MTERDLAVLRLLSEHHALSSAHVAALLRVTERTARARVRRLVGLGMLQQARVGDGHPPACWVTTEGLRAAGSRLPAPRFEPGRHRHDVGVGWLWLAARDGAFGPVAAMHSDRQMRSSDQRSRRSGPRLGVGLGVPGPKGHEQRHYPDILVTLQTGHRVAVELELSMKSRRRLDAIMRGYASDRRIDAVVYLTDVPAVARAVRAAAGRAGIAGLVHVQPLAPGSPVGAPGPSRALGRTGPGRAAVSGRASVSGRTNVSGRTAVTDGVAR